MMSALLILSALCWITRGAARINYSEESANATIPESEISALHDLFQATNGEHWSWNPHSSGIPWNFTGDNIDPCNDNWQGIRCGNRGLVPVPHVVSLTLPHYRLEGTLPDTIGNLTYLEIFQLESNGLRGSIPQTIGINMFNLTLFSVHENYMNGHIPVSFGELQRIKTLDCSGNHLSGPIPPTLSNLPSVVSLDLAQNSLTSTIPAALGNLSTLQSLLLHGNYIQGFIPLTLCKLSQLRVLQLSGNKLNGVLPECLGDLTHLVDLIVKENRLGGTLPPQLGKLPALQNLWLHNNSFVGTIPSSFGNISTLIACDLGYNSLHGSIPESFGNLTLLQSLLVSNNEITGTIPEFLGNLTQLNILYLHYNSLRGTIPTSFQGLANLEELYLQNNKLTGSIDGVFNSSTQTSMLIVQLSNNRLTGKLPAEPFLLPRLTTFVAVSNCITGSLPPEMCTNKELTSIILDGVQTAPHCRDDVLPHTEWRSYVVPNKFGGTVPACLFRMPNLTSLHISGNGLEGTLPDVAEISPRLVDFTVSYNALTGTIPRAFQEIKWKNLDLSYNRFTGTLRSNFGSEDRDLTYYLIHEQFKNDTNTSTINIENNRLSGHVPHAMLKYKNITLLGTNLFTCDLDKSDIPKGDKNRDNYECDSDSFNIPMFFWLGLFVIVCVVCAIGLNYFGLAARVPWAKHAIDAAKTWSLDDASLPRNFRYVVAVSDILCKISVWCTALIVMVLVPWYAIASHYYGTYEYQYAWTVSAAFLSGSAATGVEIFFYLALMVFLVASFAYLILRYDRKQSKNRGASRPESLRLGKAPQKPPFSLRVLVYSLYLFVNLFVVGGFNVAFVLVALNQSANVLLVAQVVLSIFKLLWNSVVTPFLIRFIANRMSRSTHDTAFVTVQVVIALFNNITVPCFVVAIVSPSCFSSVFETPTPVTSVFVFETCTQPGQHGTCGGDGGFSTQVLSTSYDPPFRYDYQCSSSFVTYYAPAFIFLSIAASFATPVAKFIGMRLHRRATPGTLWYRFLDNTVPRIFYPISHVYNNRMSNMSLGQLSESTISSVLSYDTLERQVYFPYFDANIFIITLLTYLGILLTFGVVFPPLAVAMCVTMISVAWQAKLAVGRFLHQARELNATKFAEIIEQECKGAVTIPKIRRSLFIIICFSCSFYALFMYDTLGNDVGQKKAYWVLIVMPLFPLLIYAVIWWRRQQQGVLNLDFHLASAAAAQTDGVPLGPMKKSPSANTGSNGSGRSAGSVDSTASGRGASAEPAVSSASGPSEREEDATYNALRV